MVFQSPRSFSAFLSRAYDPSGFVVLADQVPRIVQEIRYHSSFNFIGERIDGYEQPCAILTSQAASALKSAADEFAVRGLAVKVFDAYRPVSAVRQFVLWGIEDQDLRMKPFFYPDLDKQELFVKGYIARRSSHSRGSAVDLTLIDMLSGKELDMGSQFDFFGAISHPDSPDVTDEQHENRMILQKVMKRCGFAPLDSEWWHFCLEDEPFPDTYFEFPVSADYLRKNSL